MREKITCGVIFVSMLCDVLAFADSPPSFAVIVERAELQRRESMNKCSDGSALDQSRCLQKVRTDIDAELKAIIEQALNETENMWGEEATKEQKAQILEAQEAWEIYKHKHCWHDYVPSQSVNVSSRQASNLACEMFKTLLRIEEVKVDYLHQW